MNYIHDTEEQQKMLFVEYPRMNELPLNENCILQQAIYDYAVFSKWIVSKSQPLFIVYKYLVKLVNRGKINKISLDILTTDIWKFIQQELYKTTYKFLERNVFQEHKGDAWDFVGYYLWGVCLLDKLVISNMPVVRCMDILHRHNTYYDNIELLKNAKKNNYRVIYEFKNNQGVMCLRLCRIDKVCPKTLKIWDTSDRYNLCINTKQFNIYIITDNSITDDEIYFKFSMKNRFCIPNPLDNEELGTGVVSRSKYLKGEIEKFTILMKRLKPIIMWDKEEWNFIEDIRYNPKKNTFINYEHIFKKH